MNELTNQPQSMPLDVSDKSIFSNVEKFEQVKYMSEYLSRSNMVPKDYQGKPENVLIALSMAERMKADPMMVMQNLYVIHGRPSWSSQFLISCANSCGRFSTLQYEFFGKANTDDWGCVAYATELASGDVVKGPSVTIAMAKAEGWHGKNGSKWKTLPELMLTYRAAAFFVRTKAPELAMGMQTTDEVRDMGAANVVIENEAPAPSAETEIMANDLKSLKKPATKKPVKLESVKPEPVKEAADIDIVKFMKMSIDSCFTLDDLEECGADIGIKKDDGEFTDAQLGEVKRYYADALKKIKNP